MLRPTNEELQSRIDNPFVVVIIAAKRAKQLSSGHPKLVDANSSDIIKIALEEIAKGKIKCRKEGKAEKEVEEAEKSKEEI